MLRVDEETAVRHLDKVQQYRRAEILRMYPDMGVDEAEELATSADRVILEKVRRLAADGCPAFLAHRILKPLGDGLPEGWA